MALFQHPSTSASSSHEPLTIFYSGTVNVFADVPPSKARAVMLLLNSADSIATRNTQPPPSPVLMPQPPRKRSESDLPFARKASLARFLERRRGRVENNLNQEAAAAAAASVEEGNDVADPAHGDEWINQKKKKTKVAIG